MRSLLIPILCVIASCHAFSQEKQEKQEDNTVRAVGFSSQFLVSSDLQKSVFFNMIGGQIRYAHKDFAASIAIMPTLRFYKDEHLDPDEDIRPFVTPGFSVGLLFMQKRLMLGFPISYSYDNHWHPTIGFGYKFGKL